ncbi:MAG: iron-siderophore ABC transporter substrate-binding protein [Rubrobacter sp.]|nr:iron-siderophore ABC transporter substrate-binding protein [Rubrobacter sp.]
MMKTNDFPGVEVPPEIVDDFTRRKFLIGVGLITFAPACGSGGESSGGTNSSGGTRTIEHKFGSAEVPENVERVVAVGFNEADFALALGVVPVGVRDFIGPYPEETRPWAQDALESGEEPELVGGEEINFEAVAALEPDVILGIYSFMTQENYDLLAEIAPTVAQPAEYEDGGTPWQEQMHITGRALGMEARAEEVVAEVEGRFDEARESHPDFEGKTAAITLIFEEEFYVLESTDLRTLLFTSLGFEMPEETGPVSRERVDLLDRDALVFVGADREDLADDELIQSLEAAEEGRVVYFGDLTTDFAGALGYSSPLSLPFALEEAVPRLAAAVDGDPETKVESAS